MADALARGLRRVRVRRRPRHRRRRRARPGRDQPLRRHPARPRPAGRPWRRGLPHPGARGDGRSGPHAHRGGHRQGARGRFRAGSRRLPGQAVRVRGAAGAGRGARPPHHARRTPAAPGRRGRHRHRAPERHPGRAAGPADPEGVRRARRAGAGSRGGGVRGGPHGAGLGRARRRLLQRRAGDHGRAAPQARRAGGHRDAARRGLPVVRHEAGAQRPLATHPRLLADLGRLGGGAARRHLRGRQPSAEVDLLRRHEQRPARPG